MQRATGGGNGWASYSLFCVNSRRCRREEHCTAWLLSISISNLYQLGGGGGRRKAPAIPEVQEEVQVEVHLALEALLYLASEEEVVHHIWNGGNQPVVGIQVVHATQPGGGGGGTSGISSQLGGSGQRFRSKDLYELIIY